MDIDNHPLTDHHALRRARWLYQGVDHYLQTHDGVVHARVEKRSQSYAKPWICWSGHLEGNDTFDTPEEAKIHIEKRLCELLDDVAVFFV